MLLQSGHHFDADQLCSQSDTNATTNPNTIKTLTTPPPESQRYLDLVQSTLKDEWSVHSAKDGRLFYCKYVFDLFVFMIIYSCFINVWIHMCIHTIHSYT